MKLFEFADNDPLRVKLVAVTNQLKERLAGQSATMSTDELLNFLKQNNVVLDKSDLFDIVKKDPLKNIIHNVNKDEVVFKGQEGAEEMGSEPGADENEKIRQQLASKQTSKL
jgi:hypothetical protein